jgi:hypothetical protein
MPAWMRIRRHSRRTSYLDEIPAAEGWICVEDKYLSEQRCSVLAFYSSSSSSRRSRLGMSLGP